MSSHDVCISGAGPVGMTLALALARQGLKVALRAERPAPQAPASSSAVQQPQAQDVRAYALSPASVGLLASLKVWDALPADARTIVHDMWIDGDEPGHRLHFSAWRQRVEGLAWIVDAAALQQALSAALAFAPHVDRVEVEVPSSLRVLAEGRDSQSRAALGVRVQTEPYGQTAVVARLVGDRPHAGLARQWFRGPDVLALLPFDRPRPGLSFALVWSLPDERAHALLASEPAAFSQALTEATAGLAGPLHLNGERAAWPLRLARAHPICGPGWVLVGDAAHVVHPLAGQGLNLGLGDVACLARVLGERERWRPLGDERLLRRYARERWGPTASMAWLTDGLLHLFAERHEGLRSLRNQGLSLLDRLPPLKNRLVARALRS